MLKKFGAIVLVVTFLALSSINAYAGQADAGHTTQPAINTDEQPDITGGAIKSTNSSKGAIESDPVTSESSISSKSAITSKGPSFEEVFADALANGKAANDDEFLMKITSPDKDKSSTYSSSYILSGNSEYKDVVIAIAKYNPDTKKYEPMYNTDGESSWDIGDFRMFSKFISLDMGVNKIKIVSYRTSEMQLADPENIQVNCFTIERLNKSIAERAIKTIEKGVENTLKFFTGKSSKQ